MSYSISRMESNSDIEDGVEIYFQHHPQSIDIEKALREIASPYSKRTSFCLIRNMPMHLEDTLFKIIKNNILDTKICLSIDPRDINFHRRMKWFREKQLMVALDAITPTSQFIDLFHEGIVAVRLDIEVNISHKLLDFPKGEILTEGIVRLARELGILTLATHQFFKYCASTAYIPDYICT